MIVGVQVFSQVWGVLSYSFFKQTFAPPPCSSPSEAPVVLIFILFMVSHRSLRIFSLFHSFSFVPLTQLFQSSYPPTH